MTDSESDSTSAPHDIDGVWVDRGPGSGALNDTESWAQQKHYEYGFANDGRSHTRTTFYWKRHDDTPARLRDRDRLQPHRAPEDRRSWEELAQWNDGKHSSTRKEDNYTADVQRWVETFCGYLDLNPYRERRVQYIMANIDINSFGSIKAEYIIMGVITLVVDSDTNADPDDWSPDDWIVYRDDFESLMADLEMDRDTLWTVRKIVHHNTDFFDTGLDQ